MNGDPGDGWSVSGIENATKIIPWLGKILFCMVMKVTGKTLLAATEEDSEWIVLDNNDWAYLGFHLDQGCTGTEYLIT